MTALTRLATLTAPNLFTSIAVSHDHMAIACGPAIALYRLRPEFGPACALDDRASKPLMLRGGHYLKAGTKSVAFPPCQRTLIVLTLAGVLIEFDIEVLYRDAQQLGVIHAARRSIYLQGAVQFACSGMMRDDDESGADFFYIAVAHQNQEVELLKATPENFFRIPADASGCPTAAAASSGGSPRRRGGRPPWEKFHTSSSNNGSSSGSKAAAPALRSRSGAHAYTVAKVPVARMAHNNMPLFLSDSNNVQFAFCHNSRVLLVSTDATMIALEVPTMWQMHEFASAPTTHWHPSRNYECCAGPLAVSPTGRFFAAAALDVNKKPPQPQRHTRLWHSSMMTPKGEPANYCSVYETKLAVDLLEDIGALTPTLEVGRRLQFEDRHLIASALPAPIRPAALAVCSVCFLGEQRLVLLLEHKVYNPTDGAVVQRVAFLRVYTLATNTLLLQEPVAPFANRMMLLQHSQESTTLLLWRQAAGGVGTSEDQSIDMVHLAM